MPIFTIASTLRGTKEPVVISHRDPLVSCTKANGWSYVGHATAVSNGLDHHEAHSAKGTEAERANEEARPDEPGDATDWVTESGMDKVEHDKPRE